MTVAVEGAIVGIAVGLVMWLWVLFLLGRR